MFRPTMNFGVKSKRVGDRIDQIQSVEIYDFNAGWI